MGFTEIGGIRNKRRGPSDMGKYEEKENCTLCGVRLNREWPGNMHPEFPQPFFKGLGKLSVCKKYTLQEIKVWVVGHSDLKMEQL
jgi:rRNA maturation protein Nop10